MSHSALKAALSAFIPNERLIDDPLRTLAYGTDASFYRLVPKLVVKLVDESEVVRLLAAVNQFGVPVTFRAAGTSLSGQAVTDSVLAVLEGNAWRDYEISPDGSTIRLQPGVIGAQANAYLAPLNKKIGPDPASIGTAKIGGIAANNASGMCCGTAQNSYHTLDAMRIVFVDGSVLDTADPVSVERFREEHQTLLRGIEQLVARLADNPVLAQRVRHKFRMKNTTGYGINALLDYQDPIDVIPHLMIGSEGTLGFISEITYRTVPDHPHKATALVLFHNLEEACRTVTALKEMPVDAVELMDRPALRSVQDLPGQPDHLQSLGPDGAALLIDIRGPDSATLRANMDAVTVVIAGFETAQPVQFSEDPVEYARLWGIRKGLFPAVGAVRPAGTTCVIEDVAFPVEDLAAATRQLQELLHSNGYEEAIIFGHALAGNLHFVFTPEFSSDEAIQRYRKLMDEVANLVTVEYQGSLKAEHGTGRNMAPFVEMEWGAEAYALMREIKTLFDPRGLLNRGVIINDDPEIHLKNLKPLPAADPRVDRCIECGFCEPICPSRNLTLSPRQRIVALREQARLERLGDTVALEALNTGYRYASMDTCATDGLCASRCPVGIDTGAMIKSLRAQHSSAAAGGISRWVDRRMAGVTAATRFALRSLHGISKLVGPAPVESLSRGVRRLSGNRLPAWDRYDARGASNLPLTELIDGEREKDKLCVYFTACVSRTLGTSSNDPESRDLSQVMMNLLNKAGFDVITPDNMNTQCCGMPYESRGVGDTARASLARLEEALWVASNEGRLPILCDTSPCTARMVELFEKPMRVLDTVTFIREYILPELKQVKRVPNIAVHVTCSTRKMNLDNDLIEIAKACADEIFMPEETGCCGFAGDRGYIYPELNASALSRLKGQLPATCREGVSNSRTCEIGLSRHAGIPYRSIAYLVDRCFVAPND
ncbi:FAD-binding and (Fe-S)-binding domain-containing protein [Sedimenticola thiotaurini]|uniref:D-lactate dehydrogenase (cytochrome) n=1 Tax=Sedimenticola thiotaurini TaxID=1543721 RepID=A0A0F7JTF3_9GAMM|nr:FAD-binding and (Fe-S)-binding domain-containing protein [Sedimenticola thiotaurini]AKH19791.1 4Fe-4S ferredoxin [Sedimenticola thiotaurini]